MMAPALVPDAVHVTRHASERYYGRRNTNPAAVETGIRRLLERAAEQPTPPLRMVGDHAPHRSMRVGGFLLVFDADMRTLITLWRQR